MATGKGFKQGFVSRFMHWYASYQGKNIVNIIYSAGASVVIIGALFKILHWPGASQVLMIGMFTEAFLFLIGTLERPHPEFHWENVFPQLLEYGTEPELLEEKARQPRPTLLGAGVEGGSYPTDNGGVVVPTEKSSAPAAKAPSLKDEDYKALKDGIADLAKTASQFAELGKVAQTSVKLNEKLAAAEAAADSYSEATSALAQRYTQASGELQHVTEEIQHVTEEMQHVTAETRTYKQGVEQAGKNLAALNSVYELQLQTVNEQTAAHKEVIAATKAITTATNNVVTATNEMTAITKEAAAAAKEAVEAQNAYVKSSQLLQKQVAELNSIYGNMLNALA